MAFKSKTDERTRRGLNALFLFPFVVFLSSHDPCSDHAIAFEVRNAFFIKVRIAAYYQRFFSPELDLSQYRIENAL